VRALRVVLRDGLAAVGALILQDLDRLRLVLRGARTRWRRGRLGTVELEAAGLEDSLGEGRELRAAGRTPGLPRGDQFSTEGTLKEHIFERRTASRAGFLVPCYCFAAGYAAEHENMQGFLAHGTKMRKRLFK